MSGWTANDIGDLGGRRAVVTGANSGLGLQTALELARHGASVVMACRNIDKGRAAAERIRTETGGQVELAALDLASLDSVRAFAAGYDGALDLLVNNAGVMALPRAVTADGFEMQFGTNHLGHFALTGLLLDRLLAAPAGRVVTVSSGMHKIGRMNFEDLMGARRYRKWPAYGQSKLANLLFTAELDRRLRTSGARLIAVAAHPGFAATNLQTAGPKLAGNSLMERLMEAGNRVFAQSDAAGAWPSLYAATAPQVTGGGYYGPGGIGEMRGNPTTASRTKAAQDPAAAARLWTVSEELTGVRYEGLPVRA